MKELLDRETPGRRKRTDHQVGTMPDGTPLNAREYQQTGHTNAMVYGELHGKRMDIGSYEQIAAMIKASGMSDQEFARQLAHLVKTGAVPEQLARDPKNAGFAGALKLLMFNREAARNPMAILTAVMGVDLVQSGAVTWEELFTGKALNNQGRDSEWGGGGLDPMSMKKAPAAARRMYQQHGMEYPFGDDRIEKTLGTNEQAEELKSREAEMLLRWLNQKVGQQNLVFKSKQEAEYEITKILIGLCQEWYGKKLAPKGR